jgi:hypothetical protein
MPAAIFAVLKCISCLLEVESNCANEGEDGECGGHCDFALSQFYGRVFGKIT